MGCPDRAHFKINLRPNPSAFDQTTFPWTNTSIPVLSGIFKVMICPVRTCLPDLMKIPEGLISTAWPSKIVSSAANRNFRLKGLRGCLRCVWLDFVFPGLSGGRA